MSDTIKYEYKTVPFVEVTVGNVSLQDLGEERWRVHSFSESSQMIGGFLLLERERFSKGKWTYDHYDYYVFPIDTHNGERVLEDTSSQGFRVRLVVAGWGILEKVRNY